MSETVIIAIIIAFHVAAFAYILWDGVMLARKLNKQR